MGSEEHKIAGVWAVEGDIGTEQNKIEQANAMLSHQLLFRKFKTISVLWDSFIIIIVCIGWWLVEDERANAKE